MPRGLGAFQERRRSLATSIEHTTTRFMSHVQVEDDGCWQWRGALTAYGYGQFGFIQDGRRVVRKAHTFAWTVIAGRHVPDGFQLDHLCHSTSACPGGVTCSHRRCVNPNHLEPVEPKENTRRALANMRAAHARRGERMHCDRGHELTDENLYRGRWCRLCRRKAKREHAARTSKARAA